MRNEWPTVLCDENSEATLSQDYQTVVLVSKEHTSPCHYQ
jgi:hypothetical protein